MKYLIIKPVHGGCETALLFSSVIKHADIARGLKDTFSVVSAGFWRVIDGTVSTEGSVSLGVKSRGKLDAEIIQRDRDWPDGP